MATEEGTIWVETLPEHGLAHLQGLVRVGYGRALEITRLSKTL